jgi:hypothetical protein
MAVFHSKRRSILRKTTENMQVNKSRAFGFARVFQPEVPLFLRKNDNKSRAFGLGSSQTSVKMPVFRSKCRSILRKRHRKHANQQKSGLQFHQKVHTRGEAYLLREATTKVKPSV